MIEISNLNIPLAKLDGTPETERAVIRAAVLKRLHVAPDGLLGIELHRRSIDARKKSAVHLTYTVRAQLRGGERVERTTLAKLARRRDERGLRIIAPSSPRCRLAWRLARVPGPWWWAPAARACSAPWR